MSPTRPSSVPVRRLPMVVATLAITVLSLLTSGCGPRPTLARLDEKLYRTSLPEFSSWWQHEQAAANHVSVGTIDRWLSSSPRSLDSSAARRRAFDVSTDLCSFAPDRGPTFDFRQPCIRHDFAWRNLRRLDARSGGGIDTHARRVAATNLFLTDMRTTCAARPPIQRIACRVVANSYFHAVLAVS